MQVFAHAFERVHHRDVVALQLGCRHHARDHEQLGRAKGPRRALQLQTGSVTEVAMGHGFWHMVRFAGLYKNYYGESPSSETVRAMG